MSGPRRTQTMVNKEEKMNIKQNEMNLKIKPTQNADMCEEKSGQLKRKQMMKTEPESARLRAHRGHYLHQRQP